MEQMNYLDTARLGQSGVITKIHTVSDNLQYVGTWNYLSGGIADTSQPGRRIQRIQKSGTLETIDRPMNDTSTNYKERGHIWDDRATLNRQ